MPSGVGAEPRDRARRHGSVFAAVATRTGEEVTTRRRDDDDARTRSAPRTSERGDRSRHHSWCSLRWSERKLVCAPVL